MSETSDIEDAKLEIERQKLAIERQKLDLEIVKAKWTSLSIIVPVIVVAATIVWGMIATRTQADLTFRLEAAKSVMAAETFGEQVSRAAFLRDNFPDELGSDFLKKLDIQAFPDAPNIGPKFQFINLIAARGLNPEETAELYHIMYPTDEWSWQKNVQVLLSRASSRPPAK
jgi:hypothetical protein